MWSGVFGVETEGPDKLAKRAIHLRAHLVVGKTYGAGGGIDVGVFDGISSGKKAEGKSDSQCGGT